MDIDFHCTQCGACCRDLWLPLSTQEAIRWLEDGHPVELLCEAIPWPQELPASQHQAIYKRARSFPALSGKLPVRVLVILAAPQGAGCPHLNTRNLCDIYERRPAICRTYPAETHPFLTLEPARRRCPAECWEPGGEPYLRDSKYIDPVLRKLVHSVRDRGVIEIESLRRVCRRLGIRAAALANEGYVVHRPTSKDLIEALRFRHLETGEPDAWTFVSDHAETQKTLIDCSALVQSQEAAASAGYRYQSLFAA